MADKRTYPFQGKQVPGQDVEFEAKTEPWAQYTLADGTQVKVKLVMLNAARLEAYTDQGDPVYTFQFQQLIGMLAPDELKRKAQ